MQYQADVALFVNNINYDLLNLTFLMHNGSIPDLLKEICAVQPQEMRTFKST